MKPLLICNCLDLEINNLYKNNYNYFEQYNTNLLDSDILLYDSILIVGEFYNIPEIYNGKISWVITDNTFSYSLLNKGIYDIVDNFFISYIDNDIYSCLVNRYSVNHVNMGNNIELYIGHRITPPRKNSNKQFEIKFLSVLDDIQKITDFRDNTVRKKILSGGSLSIKTNINNDILDKQIMFSLTGDPSFFYEKKESISCSVSFQQTIEDLYNKYKLLYNFKNSNKNLEIVNINFIDKYQINIIKSIYSLELELKENIILDTDIFKTFYTDHFIYKKNKKIPYSQKWIGILVNPFNKETDFSLNTLLKNEEFKQSLKFCKSIIVFTKYLYKKIQHLGVKIINMNYPIKATDNKFIYTKWLNNPIQYIVQYPSECIDSFGIYRLELSKNCNIQKVSFIDYFENYNFKNDCFFEKRINDFLIYKKNEVKIINNMYTDMIVFMYIIDCSVIPFILECIVKNIPVVINYHESILEYFGTSYPLFYSSYSEATKIIENYSILEKGYNYLLNLNKDNYSFDKFKSKLKEIIIN